MTDSQQSDETTIGQDTQQDAAAGDDASVSASTASAPAPGAPATDLQDTDPATPAVAAEHESDAPAADTAGTPEAEASAAGEPEAASAAGGPADVEAPVSAGGAATEAPANAAEAPADAEAPEAPADAGAPTTSGEDAPAGPAAASSEGDTATHATGDTGAAEPSVPLAAEPAPLSTPSPSTAPPRPPLPTAMAPRPLKKKAQPLAAPPAHSTSLEEAGRFARVEEDGHVFLLVDGAEHPVGQYPDATREEALSYFVRKYDDVVSQVALLEQRVQAKAPSSDMAKTAKHLRAQVGERKMVGDVLTLEARIEALLVEIGGLEKSERAAQDALKAKELAAREAIVAEAEELAGRDPSTVQWKASSTRMNELFELWKAAQKAGPRLGRGTEDALWKRFRSARTVFDRHRRAYFSQLDSDNAEAKQAKEALIKRAEQLSDSTDWGSTAAEYRHLMDEWKSSKRASRKDDDALWARFRAAQDRFFEARKAANEAVDEEYSGNLTAKEALLKEAQQILPIRDLAAAKKALQSVRDRWDEAGKVPRADMGRIDAGLRKVEDAVKAADDEHWTKTNPETKARTNSALSQLEATIAQLKDDLADAERAGNAKKIATAREALAAREQWLEMLQRSAQDFS
ncbi:DUF349 domain-containing protein [Arthrobacter sp. B0490]|uniref:DUF349 domain-containing protein n=1 Tax=Arthrobacter sp. B0490 TaxID=2058891 RepID=UPI002158073D|nr:DUF349 domain-containing protein [Arthrobacter sp. B0490]